MTEIPLPLRPESRQPVSRLLKIKRSLDAPLFDTSSNRRRRKENFVSPTTTDYIDHPITLVDAHDHRTHIDRLTLSQGGLFAELEELGAREHAAMLAELDQPYERPAGERSPGFKEEFRRREGQSQLAALAVSDAVQTEVRTRARRGGKDALQAFGSSI